MEKHNLNVSSRAALGKGGARGLRRKELIPGVMYRGGDSLPIEIAAKELSQFISKTAGEQVLVNLNFHNDTKMAIVKDYQVDPIRGGLLHVDFQEISATEEIKISVHIVTTGESIGVKRDKGILQYGVREMEIECLPEKIPGHITVDISNLGIGQSIHVRDIQLGEGIKLLSDPGEMIIAVTTIKEEVAAAPEAAAEVAEPEVIKKGKKPEEGEEKEKEK
ncbi:MAG TPA: 50S ribosomal protein L25 [Dissulfurispiraceae bacterium]|nr:50S ribosomal protein L25 [Dissulfurispiraceae bacterium]